MFTKKYLQDRLILFLNLFLAGMTLLTIIISVLMIDTSKQFAINRYRLFDGTLDGYSRTEPLELYSFALASLFFAAVAIYLSAKLYKQKRFMSIMLLALTAVVLIFNFVVSYAVFSLQ